MNLILEDSESVTEYSYLDAVFAAAPELCELHWLITDIEASDEVLGSEPVLIDGHALNEILQAKHIQFRWAVFSGFKIKPLKLPDAYHMQMAMGLYGQGHPSHRSKMQRLKLYVGIAVQPSLFRLTEA